MIAGKEAPAVDLSLEISPRIMGRTSIPLTAAVVRALTVEDLGLLELERGPSKSGLGALQRISERHHAIARLVAQGLRNAEIAAIVNYSEGRVSLLRGDPAFQELVAFYRTSEQRDLRTNFERLTGLASDAADVLQERLEDEPEKITTGQLIEVIKLGADRTGLGPQSSSVQLNINANLADRMKAAREAARKATEPPTIEAEK